MYALICLEYIRLLKLHVAKGSRAGAVSTSYQHLDRSSYWRAESERMKNSLKSTEDELIDLRREVAALKAGLDAARPSSPTKKRKKKDEETVHYPRSPKRSKRDALSISVLGTFDSLTEAHFSQGGETGNALLRSVSRMHSILKSHNKIQPAELTYHLVQATSSISQVVLDEVQKSVSSRTQDDHGLRTTLLLTRRAVSSIINGFNRLCHVSGDGGGESQVIHGIVHMFKSFLAGTVQLSESESRKMLAADSDARKSAAEKSKAKSKTPRVFNIKENSTLSLYTTFLNSIIDLLDPKNEAHQALYEGFAFCVLDSLGKRLYHSVFGHARGDTLEAEILQSNIPSDAIDSESSSPPHDQKQVRLEAPYLIALLDRVMSVAPSYLGAAVSAKTGKPKQAHNRASMKGALAIEAKERLQRTLVTCMFGGSEAMASDPFAECLKMPVAGSESISMPKVKEQDVQDWFKEEMWRLLGWEILSKEGEW